MPYTLSRFAQVLCFFSDMIDRNSVQGVLDYFQCLGKFAIFISCVDDHTVRS